MASAEQSINARRHWLMQQPVPVLRIHAEERSINLSTCLEKSEMVQQILQHEVTAPSEPSWSGGGSSSSTAHGYPRQQSHAATDEEIARRAAAADLQRQAGEAARGHAQRRMHLSLDNPSDQMVGLPATAASSSLRSLAQRGVAVDFGSIRDQQRRAQQERQQAQASQASRDSAQSQQTAFDYGRPSYRVQEHRAHLQGSNERAQQAATHSPYPSGNVGHLRHNMLAHPVQAPTHPVVGAPNRASFSMFEALRENFTGNFFAQPYATSSSPAFVMYRGDPVPVQVGLDPSSINATTTTMTFGGAACSANPRTISTPSGPSAVSGNERVPAVHQKADTESSIVPSQCSVCLEQFQTGEELRVLPCFHRYHRNCIDEWLARSPSCPICKHQIVAR